MSELDDRWRQLAAANPGQAIYPQRLRAVGIWPRIETGDARNPKAAAWLERQQPPVFLPRWWKEPVLLGARRPWWRRWAWCVLRGFDEVAEGSALTRFGAKRRARRAAAAHRGVARLLEMLEMLEGEA